MFFCAENILKGDLPSLIGSLSFNDLVIGEREKFALDLGRQLLERVAEEVGMRVVALDGIAVDRRGPAARRPAEVETCERDRVV